MHSTPLFYTHPYKRSLETSVHSCVKQGDSWCVVLNETIFYPEGGGQPGDRGMIDDVAVSDTQIDPDGTILHYCNAPVSKKVRLTLDWTRRYQYMVFHSAQHLISAGLAAIKYSTVSVHLSKQSVYIDIDAPEFSEQSITAVLNNVQQGIHDAASITAYTVSSIDGITFRRPPAQKALAKLDQMGLRIVEIEGIDRVACAGVHLDSCAEIDLVLFQGSEKIRGIIRTGWLVGGCAVKQAYLLQKNAQIIKKALSSSIDALPQRIQTMQTTLREKTTHIRMLNRKFALAKINTTSEKFIVLQEDEQELMAEIIPALLKRSKTIDPLSTKGMLGVYCVCKNTEKNGTPQVNWVLVCSKSTSAIHDLYVLLNESLDPDHTQPILKGSCSPQTFELFLKQVSASSAISSENYRPET